MRDDRSNLFFLAVQLCILCAHYKRGSVQIVQYFDLELFVAKVGSCFQRIGGNKKVS